MMNWEAIGAIGEILGAFAVVLTLAYLAVQVRYAKLATADQNRLNRANGVCDVMLAIANNNQLRMNMIENWGTTQHYCDLAGELDTDIEKASQADFIYGYWFLLHWGQFASSTTEKDMAELPHLITQF